MRYGEVGPRPTRIQSDTSPGQGRNSGCEYPTFARLKPISQDQPKCRSIVEHHLSPDERITQAIDVRVEQNGHTKYIFDPAIKVPVGSC